MPDQDPTLEPRDSWPKTEKTFRAIGNTAIVIFMMLDYVIRDKLPEFVIKNLEELNNQAD